MCLQKQHMSVSTFEGGGGDDGTAYKDFYQKQLRDLSLQQCENSNRIKDSK